MQGVELTEVGNQEWKSLKQKQGEPATEPEKVVMLMASDVEGATPLEVEGGTKSGQWWWAMCLTSSMDKLEEEGAWGWGPVVDKFIIWEFRLTGLAGSGDC